MDDAFKIQQVNALQVLDSRGRPTLKVIVKTKSGAGYGYAPSGASRGEREAIELRDGGKKWLGYGVMRAITIVETMIKPRLVGLDSRYQAFIDSVLIALDGTPNKSKLGGNTTTATSIAVARSAAGTASLELFEYLGGPGARLLPTPLLNVINGGVHAGNELNIQEFMIIPVGADTFYDAMRMAVEVYGILKKILKEKYGLSAVNVGDEGGFAPPIKQTRQALDLLIESIQKAGYTVGTDFYLGIDAAASQFYSNEEEVYHLDGKSYSPGDLVEYYAGLVDEYPIRYIEDPFHEDAFNDYAELTRKIGKKVLIVGDDLYTTNTRYLEKGLEIKATNAVLVKINQIGTLTETIEFIRYAVSHGMRAIISHRSGDTEDPFIADLAVAMTTGLIKTGAPARGERTAKYNRLLEIESILQGSSQYAGVRPFKIG
ncbi:MAG: phosphopyruvate hydratase [Desulfurococcales archaeon]|nr:phosphopyruvate hydratase [Desulfurococcales archaeon]